MLEGAPHGAVHVGVGGWMGSVPTAAQDPIFYLHHCNMDRLWNLWLAQGGRTDPLSDATWKNTPFTFFDEHGTAVTMTSCDVLRAAKQLHYTYEGEPPQVDGFCAPPIAVVQEWVRETVFRVPVPPIVLGAKPVSFAMDLAALRRHAAGAAARSTESVFLELDDVEADRQPGVVWQVYFGLPDGAAFDANGPYYVGTLALFGAGVREEAHHFMPAKVTLRINEALRRVLDERKGRVSVTLVPTGIEVNGKPTAPEPAATVRIGRVNVVVERQAAPAT
jgi:tyrosinase